MGMRKKFRDCNFVVIVLALIFASIMFLKTAYAQDDVIRVDTNLVTVPVTVLDRNGRYISNLKKEDFQIFENGIEQEIDLFESVEQPITVLLLLDVSGSMSSYLAELTRAANAFALQLRPNDQMAAATFAVSFRLLLKPKKVSDLNKSVKIQKHIGDSWTRIYDAVDDALRLMKKIRGRKAIVLFSDGGGEGIYSSLKDNFRKAEEGESLIYTIQFDNFITAPPSHANNKEEFYKALEEANNYMKDLANITGGRPYRIKNIANLEKTFASITEELRQQYNLGYYPKTKGKKGERRQIKVRVSVPNVAVRARSSYVIEDK